MRVLVAPDAFDGTLTAPAAARAIAEGWLRRAPDDQVTQAPMADGGTGFVDVLHTALGGELQVVTVPGPHGAPTPMTLLVHDDTVYVESSQACGHQVAGDGDPERASSRGVGEAVAAALAVGPARVVVGVGGCASNDGGAGLLSALGVTADVPLDAGPLGLEGLTVVDATAARAATEGVELVVATDVTTVLLGMFGTTNVHGADRGLDEDARQRVDRLLDGWVDALCGRTPAERRAADAPGSGAGGGIGLALMQLGATRRSGIEVVADAVGLRALAAAHDVVVTGEGAYDFSSREGKVAHGVATVAGEAIRPCVVLAGRVLVGAREMRAMGVEAAYAVVDLVGEEAAVRDPAASLSRLATRVARTWSF
ncbi:glycerate kinase [Solicola sp. PLA-1-18]|uniref:glycerate kinase family protein n=1 Tax=Solicola sp. PLA-1-18 TaxID=3380532 RepID=UPI003B7A8869